MRMMNTALPELMGHTCAVYLGDVVTFLDFHYHLPTQLDYRESRIISESLKKDTLDTTPTRPSETY